VIDRDAAARLGITVSQIDNTLYDAFGPAPGFDHLCRAQTSINVVMEGRTALLAESGDG